MSAYPEMNRKSTISPITYKTVSIPYQVKDEEIIEKKSQISDSLTILQTSVEGLETLVSKLIEKLNSVLPPEIINVSNEAAAPLIFSVPLAEEIGIRAQSVFNQNRRIQYLLEKLEL